MGFRFFSLTATFGLLFGALGYGLFRIQIEQGFYYFEKTRARIEAIEELELRRGQIFLTDKHGKDIPAAYNRDFPVIYAAPKEIKEPGEAAKSLAPLIHWEEGELLRVLSDSENLFRLLYDKASPELTKAVRDEKIAGVYVDEKQYRFYPYGKLASHVLGFVGLNDEHNEPAGLYGIEKLLDKKLAEGGDVRLTIDRDLQGGAEQTLEELIEKFGAIGGTVIIQEPKTGKILALVNKPDFDPNNYGEHPVSSFMNPSVQYIYEPGSVFKPLTMAAGIDSRALTPETEFFDSGSVTLNGKTIKNWDEKSYGRVTMTNVIERSINTGAVFAESLIGHERFYEYLKKFGFGEKTGIDLPDEVAGDLKNLLKKDARAIDFATASFGQGAGVTPIQLISAFSALANGGLLMRPFVSRDAAPYVVRRVVDEETAEKVVMMMESAVEKAGVAAITGYRVAGKTGTAFIPDFERGGYSDELIHNYVGFLPASSPRFAILLKLDKPNVELAGMTVVAAFRNLAEYVLNYYNVPPDKLTTNP